MLGFTARLSAQHINFENAASPQHLNTAVFVNIEESLGESERYLLNHRWTMTRGMEFSKDVDPASAADTSSVFITAHTSEDSSYVLLRLYRGGNGFAASVKGGMDQLERSDAAMAGLVAEIHAVPETFYGPLQVTHLLGLQTFGKWAILFEDRDAYAQRINHMECFQKGLKAYVDAEKLLKPNYILQQEKRSEMGFEQIFPTISDDLDRVSQLPNAEAYYLSQEVVKNAQGDERVTIIYKLNQGIVFAVSEDADGGTEAKIPLAYLEYLTRDLNEEEYNNEDAEVRAQRERKEKILKKMNRESNAYRLMQEQTVRYIEHGN